MIEGTVSLEEFKTLNEKVAKMSESCIACRTGLVSDVDHLKEELKETKKDVSEIKVLINKISEQVSNLTVRVSLIVAVIVGLANFVAPLIFHK